MHLSDEPQKLGMAPAVIADLILVLRIYIVITPLIYLEVDWDATIIEVISDSLSNEIIHSQKFLLGLRHGYLLAVHMQLFKKIELSYLVDMLLEGSHLLDSQLIKPLLLLGVFGIDLFYDLVLCMLFQLLNILLVLFFNDGIDLLLKIVLFEWGAQDHIVIEHFALLLLILFLNLVFGVESVPLLDRSTKDAIFVIFDIL